MKMFPQRSVDLNIKTYFEYLNEKNEQVSLDENYDCKSITDVRNIFNDIKKVIDAIESAINKKLSVINIDLSGHLDKKPIQEKFKSFHDFREFLEKPRSINLLGTPRECGFGLQEDFDNRSQLPSLM